MTDAGVAYSSSTVAPIVRLLSVSIVVSIFTLYALTVGVT